MKTRKTAPKGKRPARRTPAKKAAPRARPAKKPVQRPRAAKKEALKAPEKPPRGVPKKAAFLAAFITTASVTKAAKAAQIERGLHYRWLEDDPKYRERFDRAKAEAAQTLEDEAVRRAREGTIKPVFYQGEVCGEVFEYSDALMIQLLKAWMPDKYRERITQEITGRLDLVERLAAARRRVAQQKT